ncbi:MAG: amidohydrolase family protein [Bacillota bacterium]
MKKIIGAEFLIKGKGQVEKNWGIIIKNDRLEEVGSLEKLKLENPELPVEIHENGIISPGFINSHMHLYGVLSHGIVPPVEIKDFTSFLEDFWWPLVEDQLTHKLIRKATYQAAVELINSGVTTVVDILEAPMAIPGALEVEAEVLKELGLRGVLSFEASERVNQENAELGLKENIKFANKFKDDSLISGRQCTHTLFTCSKDYLQKAFESTRGNSIGHQLHISESIYEVDFSLKEYQKRPVEVYDELNLLDSNLLVSQAVKVNQKEIEILKENQVGVAHLPLSNCEVGGGVSPVPDMLEAGIDVGLGTDGYINNFFEVMRGAFLIHKAYRENPGLMSAETVYQIATEGGANALKREDIGRLEAGMKADFILIEPTCPTPINKKNIFDQLILYCNPENVKEVVVGGRKIKSNGKIANINISEIRKATREAAKELWRSKDNENK